MTLGRALAIFEFIDESEASDIEKGLAISKILNMETHNSVTKQSMLKVIAWLWDKVFELKKEGEG
jgi:hypothetical protein